MHDLSTIPDFGLGWLDASGPHSEIVLSTRVRLARNIQGHTFGPRIRKEDRAAVLSAVRGAAPEVGTLSEAAVLELDDLEPRSRRILLERRLVSRELVGQNGSGPSPGAAVILSGTEPVGVMVNEEDHLRMQCLMSGLQLREAWRSIDRLDEELGGQLSYAFHHEFGYLTSCPTNVGTGLRASVLMHLPGLVLTKEIGKVLQGLGQVGLTFRGLYGEGSEVVGNFFQVSNQTTLGKTEEDLLDHLQEMVEQVIEYESRAREVLLRDASSVTEDKIWRAYGLLRYARTISFEEVMNLLSGVRLGAAMKLLPGLRVYTLNKLMIYAQSAHLEDGADRELPPSERDERRASYVRRILASEGHVPPDRTSGDDGGNGQPS